ncbi:MAG: YdbL family protein [Rickettsiales bacterium]
MKKLLLLSSLMLTFATAAMALDLNQARSQGLVAEKSDGYISAVSSDSEVSSLVADINNKRQQEYQRISKEKGQPVDVVAKLAAEQIKAKLSN